MGVLQLARTSAPSLESSGFAKLHIDGVIAAAIVTDDVRRSGRSHRTSVAAQGAGFAADTYVTNSGLLVPSFGLQAQTMFEWLISTSKTAAGVATPIYTFRVGLLQTTSDIAFHSVTGPAQTAAVDTGLLSVLLVVRSVGAAGVMQATVAWSHDAAAAGFANNDASAAEATSGGINNSAFQGTYVGLSINGGASAAWTVTQVRAQAIW